MFNLFYNRLLISYFLILTMVFVLVFMYTTNITLLPPAELIKKVSFTEIFIQNISSSTIILLTGIISFGAVSSGIIIYNLYLLSIAIHSAYVHSGSVFYSLFVILTHGIIEIVAIVLSFYLSTISLRLAINKLYNKRIFHVQSLNQFLQLLIVMVVSLGIAALFESQITPIVLEIILESKAK
ncbi:stage II sporulation protein M [Alkalihalobacillus sp. CinArs1]|uniref:stage II sporulation protein M n=1 Tax=Alkalihalobacillus sp. CinArs1 TaxID=2995314 RepID=UPI0022DE0692|nr:stage II sporulation protein M [Alkalihalobacillus sp. CinArs1]